MRRETWLMGYYNSAVREQWAGVSAGRKGAWSHLTPGCGAELLQAGFDRILKLWKLARSGIN